MGWVVDWIEEDLWSYGYTPVLTPREYKLVLELLDEGWNLMEISEEVMDQRDDLLLELFDYF